MSNKDKLVHTVVQVAYHRNGIGGDGFHAVVFESKHERCAKCKGLDTAGWVNGAGERQPCPDCKSTEFETIPQRMIGIVFDGPGQVAVLDIEKLVDPQIGVAFGENSWRGDRFEAELRAAIRDNESDGSVRVGPFALPTKRKRKS